MEKIQFRGRDFKAFHDEGLNLNRDFLFHYYLSPTMQVKSLSIKSDDCVIAMPLTSNTGYLLAWKVLAGGQSNDSEYQGWTISTGLRHVTLARNSSSV
mgnify:CR=1 FL=1